MIFLTGDTHRDFQRIWDFAGEMGTTQEDILIILGDADINYYLDEDDLAPKRELSQLPLTHLCVKGNHELHADEIASYEEVPLAQWHGLYGIGLSQSALCQGERSMTWKETGPWS